MADAELEQFVQALRANGPDFTGPPEQVRAGFEAMPATQPNDGPRMRTHSHDRS